MAENAFWTTKRSYDPKTQFRFRVESNGLSMSDSRPDPGDEFADELFDPNSTTIWWVKSVTKPKFSYINLLEQDFQAIDGDGTTHQYTKQPKWQPINMTLIDPVYPNVTRNLVRFMRRSGWAEELGEGENLADNQRKSISESLEPYQSMILTSGGKGIRGIGNYAPPTLKIIQLDSSGEDIETWTLYDPFPAQIDFGNLDYSSDSLVEINVTWTFNRFTVYFPELGKEQEYEYFRDNRNGHVQSQIAAAEANRGQRRRSNR